MNPSLNNLGDEPRLINSNDREKSQAKKRVILPKPTIFKRSDM